MEFYEALKTFIVADRAVPGTLKEVSGTQLSDEYFAYKRIFTKPSLNCWFLVDIASGLTIAPSFKTLKDCKDFLANLSDEYKAKIAEAKAMPFYKERCDMVTNYKPAATESFDFKEAFEALNDIYSEEDTQLSLFDF